MNIFIFTLEFPPFVGGAGYYNYNLAFGLSRIGHKVVVFTCDYPERNEVVEVDNKLSRENIEVVRGKILQRSKIWLLQSMFCLYKYLKNKKKIYDFILVTDYRAQLVYSLVYKFVKNKFAITVYGTEIDLHFKKTSLKRILIRPLVYEFFSRAEKIIAVSNFTRDRVCKYEPKWLKKLKVVYCGIDVSEFSGSEIESVINIREKVGLPINSKIIVSISRIIKEKGQDMLIRSLPLIIKKVPNVKLVIIGDGPYIENLHSLDKELNVSDYIIFTGKLPRGDIAYWLKSSDIFALISREGSRIEGFGLVYLEANACGKAVIAGRTGGVPEAVEDGVSGLLVSPTDVNEISSKIIKLLTDDALRLKLEKQSYNRVCKEFTNTIMAKNTIEALFKNG